MDYTKVFLSITLLLIISYLYDKYKSNIDNDKKFDDFQIVKQFLLGESKEITNLKNSSKPILWIHINYEKNSRNWESFLSRSNNNLNLPYFYFTLRSIISKNNEDFNICIIDDSTICKLLEREEFEYNLEKISYPRIEIIRLIALSKLVNKYGGLVVPPSFLSFQSFKNINSIINNNILVFGENKNSSVTYNEYPFIPDYNIFGSLKNNKELNNFIEYLENLATKHFTNESLFIGNINNYLLNKFRKNDIALIKSEYLGLKNIDNNEIYLDDLFKTDLIKFNKNSYGLYIPTNILLNRDNFSWFSYLSIDEILNSDFILAKLLILNCANK